MATVIQREAVVGPDGNILVDAHELAPGQRVTITIQPEEEAPPVKRHAIEIIEEMPGHRLFKTAEEVDAYIRRERESWER